ncbi:MAG: radical SAM protein [Chloroflexota bacterium]|nr:radical SAM protein [Chloroflexota bacterium]
MKILFIVQAIDYIDSIGVMLLSALAKAGGHSTHLGILSRENILDKIQTLKPDMIAYSASTGEHKYYIEANKLIKSRSPDVFTIMGGPHITFFPQFINETTLDAVCIGEGDEAFPELLERVAGGGDIGTLRNIVTRQGSDNGIRDLYQDLDNLPFPDRELFYETTEMKQWPLRSFMASRGCPYNCTYCFNHVFRKLYQGKGKIIRRHSVDYVIEEVQRVKSKYRTDCVKFYDDIFTYQADDWLREFAAKYKQKIGLPFHCLTRADLMTEDIASLLKEAGCFSVSMSIEAGNPRFRNEVLKRNMSDEQIVSAFHICRKHGIHTFSNNILGLPYATLAEEIQTIDLNLKAKASFVEFPIFHPYPHTDLGEFCIKKGIYQPDYSGLHMSYMNKSPLSCFTEKEKNIQRNLSTLGLLVIWFPFLRNLVLKRLIHLPYNKVYFLAYYLAKVYLNKTRVYPVKMGPVSMWRTLKKSFRLESFKKFDERSPGK